jgi:hypothetical protein
VNESLKFYLVKSSLDSLLNAEYLTLDRDEFVNTHDRTGLKTPALSELPAAGSSR